MQFDCISCCLTNLFIYFAIVQLYLVTVTRDLNVEYPEIA